MVETTKSKTVQEIVFEAKLADEPSVVLDDNKQLYVKFQFRQMPAEMKTPYVLVAIDKKNIKSVKMNGKNGIESTAYVVE